MDRYVRNLLSRKISFGKQETRVSEWLFLAALTMLAVALRISVRSFVADDWSVYWSAWLAELEADGFKAVAGNFYDYAPPVMYILYLITRIVLSAGADRGCGDRGDRERVYRKREKGSFVVWDFSFSPDGDPERVGLVPVRYYLYFADSLQRIFHAEEPYLDRHVVLRRGFCGKTADLVYLSAAGDSVGKKKAGSETLYYDSGYVSAGNPSGVDSRKAVYGTDRDLRVSGKQRPLVAVY